MSQLLALGFALALAGAAGCGHDLDDPETFGQVEQAAECPPSHCGVNSATLNDLPFGELHLAPGQNTGQANAMGLYIADFTMPDGLGDAVLTATNGRFQATREGQTFAGAALIDATLTVASTASNEAIEIVIRDHRLAPSWTENPFMIDQYTLELFDADTGTFEPVCGAAREFGSLAAWSVLVSGERYAWDSITVAASGPNATGWFNIGCVGQVLAKMKIIGYDPDPRANNPHTTSVAKRQATLKMMAADYCGTGSVFTEDGTPLYWTNHAGWSNNDSPENTPTESLWTREGAACLDVPRLGIDRLPEIQAHCAAAGNPLPACDGDGAKYAWKTALPISE